jgi:hypothetical protein
VNDHSDHTLDRVGAAAGLATVVLFVGIIAFGHGIEPPNHSIDDIASSASSHKDAILWTAYLGSLLTGALLLFGTVVAARLRRAEGSGGGWWLVALTGIAGTAVGLASDADIVAFVRTVDHGVRGDTLWTTYTWGPDGVLIAIPLAVFLLGAGLGARASGMLPRWLTVLPLVVAGLFVLGAGGVAGDEVDGGVLGMLLVLGYLGLLIWTGGVSVTLWRQSALRRGVPQPAAP